ncbi:MAG: folylpolyglutamate synthase/dihydrofolate synthase family protein [Planctomycetota bacterium]
MASGKSRARTPNGQRKTTRASGSIEAAPRKKRAFSTYSAALSFLNDRTNFEFMRPSRVPDGSFKLDRMRAILSHLGNPQDGLRLVHVAGSKGKGSVCEMVASCAKACGSTVGITTSPHLTDVRERIRLGDDMISESDFARLMSKCRDASDAVANKHGDATYFELLTALSLLFFAEEAVDLGVVEVGLGGRLDSTNVISPIVTAITTIQLEHTELLGDTLEEIAREKAGIIKPGVPVVVAPQDDAVLEAIRARAAEVEAPVYVLGDEIEFSHRFEATPGMRPHARVCITTPKTSFEHLPAPFEGQHQAVNCGVALAILDRLKGHGFAFNEVDVGRGLEATPRRGRLEQVWDEPRIIVDGAHTGESIAALVQAMGAHMTYDSLVVIFGCAADKNVDLMLTEIARGADKVIFTRSEGNPRAADPEELRKRFEELSGKAAQSEETIKDAVNNAARAVDRDDLICVTGSFYVAGEAKALLEAKKSELETTGAA